MSLYSTREWQHPACPPGYPSSGSHFRSSAIRCSISLPFYPELIQLLPVQHNFSSMRVKDNIERRVILWFGLVLLILASMVWVAIRNTRDTIASSDWVNHTHAVILEVDAVLSSLHSAEAAQRSFLITGDLWEQAAYRTAFAELNEHLQVAKTLTADNPRQQQQIAVLNDLITRQVDFDKSLAQARQEKGLDEVKRLLSSDAGHPLLTEIHKVITSLKQNENELLQQRDRTSHANARTTRWILLGGVGFNFVLLGLIYWLIRMDLAVRRQAAAALQEANELLESRVVERTAELLRANESLNLENLKRQWAHAALERLYRHSELIINSIDEGIYVVSRRGNIIRINPVGAQWIGWEVKDLTGQSLNTILHRPQANGDNVPWESDPIAKGMKDGHDLSHLEGMLCRKDGSRFPVRYSSHPIRDNDKIVGAVVTCVDLSR